MDIPIRVKNGDALEVQADILVLKHAQHLYGADYIVASRLSKFHDELMNSLPEPGDFYYVPTYGSLGVKGVLFVGVKPLNQFRYGEIRNFARASLSYLAENFPEVKQVSFTLHGVGAGLDEKEAFESEVAGFVDALSGSNFPNALKNIIIIEIDNARAERLKRNLLDIFPDGVVRIGKRGALTVNNGTSNRLRSVGYDSESKPHIFVAMPFDKNMYDVYHYGIRNTVNEMGVLCERADKAYFTGDVMEWVKTRIEKAILVIADLTLSNPNVYLEIGYAWGRGKKTLLLAQKEDDLKFDVQNQKCIMYENIKNLEKQLELELDNLL